jgi:hypothetical protein
MTESNLLHIISNGLVQLFPTICDAYDHNAIGYINQFTQSPLHCHGLALLIKGKTVSGQRMTSLPPPPPTNAVTLLTLSRDLLTSGVYCRNFWQMSTLSQPRSEVRGLISDLVLSWSRNKGSLLYFYHSVIIMAVFVSHTNNIWIRRRIFIKFGVNVICRGPPVFLLSPALTQSVFIQQLILSVCLVRQSEQQLLLEYERSVSNPYRLNIYCISYHTKPNNSCGWYINIK